MNTSSKDVERWMSAKDPEPIVFSAKCVQTGPATTELGQ